jgi:hypothetical protein
MEKRKSPPLHVNDCALDGAKVGTIFYHIFNVIDSPDAFDGGISFTALRFVDFEFALVPSICIA